MRKNPFAPYCKPKINTKKINFLVMFGHSFPDENGYLAQVCDCGAPCYGNVIGRPCYCLNGTGGCSS